MNGLRAQIAERGDYMIQLGLRVLRFDNRQMQLETDTVVELISKSAPCPPLQKGGRGIHPNNTDNGKEPS